MFEFRSPSADGERGDRMAYEYVKVILYAYPHLAALAEASGVAARNRALLSFRPHRDALEEMECVVQELAVRSRLLRLRAAADAFVAGCSEEERFLLEYRYFRRRKKLCEGRLPLPWSERTYYRRQSALLKRAACSLASQGWTREEYDAAFSGYSPFVRLLRAICDGRESAVTARREACGLAFAPAQNSCCSRGGFLPRSKMTATATAATQASTMTAICTAPGDSPCAAGGVSSTAEVSCR